MKLEITRVSNGYILSVIVEGEAPTQQVFEEGLDGTRSLLWHVADELGQTGSRYDKERIYIGVRRGDKYEGGDVEDGEQIPDDEL